MGSSIADFFAKLSLVPDKKSFDAADKMLGAIKGALVGLVAIKTGQWFAGLVGETQAAGDAAVKTSQKLGITAEAYQELAYAAGQSGSSGEELASSLGKFAKQADAASKGGKDAAAAFAKVGVSAAELRSGKLSPDAALAKIADRFATMDDGPKKAALAMSLFGKSGANLIPLLNGGAAGVEELRKEARELGIVIDTETAKSLEAFGDDQDRVKKSLEGLRNEAVKAILPALRKMTDGLLAWIKANRKMLAQRLTQVMQVLAKTLLLVGRGIAFVVRMIEGMLRNWQLVLVIVGSVAAAYIALSLASIKAAAASAAAWIAANAPIVLMGLLIAGAVLIVQDLWNAFTGGESVLKNLYNAAAGWIGEKLARVIKKARKAVDEFLYGEQTDDPSKMTVGATDISTNGKSIKQNFRERRDKAWNESVAKNATGVWARLRKEMTPEAFAAEVAGTRANIARMREEASHMSVFTPGRYEKLAQLDRIEKTLPSVTSTVNVTVPPGTDAAGVGAAVAKANDQWWSARLREMNLGNGDDGGSK